MVGDGLERGEDIPVVDRHHVVKPGVVLDPEPGRRGDVGDVAQEIGADDGVVAAARRAEHGRP